MIISHSNKFAYTRPMKVGSTSVQHMLHKTLVAPEDISLGVADNIFNPDFLTIQGLEVPIEHKEAIHFKLNLLHSTPEQLFKKGLLTEELLQAYTFISIIRNPLERFFSAWAMEVVGGYFHGDSYARLLSMLEERDFPYILNEASPKEYFYVNGVKLPQVVILNTKNILYGLQVEFPGTTFIEKHFKKTSYPKWYSKDYGSFLEPKHLNIIKERMADEIVFYEEVTGESIC